MIPERTLEEIQQRLDIVEVIGGYVSLKKMGRNFKGLCPFHPEKTPSFVIYAEKQIFICFGCHAGGDLIAFVMKHERLEFTEAVRLLAEKAGVTVPDQPGGRGKTNPELYRAHEAATRFYHELLTKSPEGETARIYLKKRGLEPETWKTFQLGYAPNRWDGLLTEAKKENLEPKVLERAGLAVPRDGNSGWYDRFRNRVMFPIWDNRGRVIGFGGRVLGDEAGPKYMNSPETELYTKSRVLYGLHLAAPAIRERDFCIVVEGYMDLVGPWQHGIRNVVASMGTSLTEPQVQLIRRHTRHVVMLYDSDYAGEMATLRGLDLFLAAEMRVKVMGLPVGVDPDVLVQTSEGTQTLVRAIQESQDLFDYKLGLLERRFDPKDPQGRIRICEEMLPTIKRVPNAIQRGEYVKRLGELLGVAEELLWAELNRAKLDASWKPTAVAGPQPGAPMTAEDLLAGLLLENPNRVAQIEGRLEKEILKDPEVQRLVTWLTERWQRGKLPDDHHAFINSLPRGSGDWESRLARWLAWADTVEEKDRALDEVIEKIRSQKHRASLESLQDSIRQSEAAGDDSTTTQLVQEYNRLMKSNR